MTEFSLYIEGKAKQDNISHLEALTIFSEESGADYDDIACLVSPTLKQKIYDEAVKSYSMPKQTAVVLDDF
jgi:hypothetical protein